MKEIIYQLRYALPLWLVSVVTGWWPDNRVSIRVRGLLVQCILKECGKNLTIGRDVTILGIDRLRLGDHVYMAKGTWINAIGGVTIEDEVIIAPYVVIASTNHGFKDGSFRFAGSMIAPVRIGHGVWLGAHATVTAGVSVGKGTLVGANAVVTRDMPDDMLVGGIPAKPIREREDKSGNVQNRTQLAKQD